MQRGERIVLTTPRSEAIRQPHKVDFVDGTHDFGDRALENFILQGRDTEGSRATIGFRNVPPPHRLRPVTFSVNALAEVGQLSVQTFLVTCDRLPVDTG